MLDPTEIEAALCRVNKALAACYQVERRAHQAGERVRARMRRVSLERRAEALRQALLQAEEPAAVANRWNLRRLKLDSSEAGE